MKLTELSTKVNEQIIISIFLIRAYPIKNSIYKTDSFSTLPENLSMPKPWLITQTGDVQEIENRKLLEGHVILDYSDTVTNFTKTISSM